MARSHWLERRAAKPPVDGFPPTADEVTACPPHHWRLERGWQQCRKCGERKRLTEYADPVPGLLRQ